MQAGVDIYLVTTAGVFKYDPHKVPKGLSRILYDKASLRFTDCKHVALILKLSENLCLLDWDFDNCGWCHYTRDNERS